MKHFPPVSKWAMYLQMKILNEYTPGIDEWSMCIIVFTQINQITGKFNKFPIC